jgi:hypothetical protein
MGIAENAVRYLCPMTKRDDQYTQALLREVAAPLSGVGGVHCRGQWMCGRYAGLQSPSQKFPQRYLVSSLAVSHLGEEKLSRGKGIAQGVVSTVARKVVPLAQGVQAQVSSLVWDVAALERAFGQGFGVDGGYRKTDSVDPLTGVAEEALFDRSVMGDHHLPGQDFEQLGENIVQKLPSCCLVVRNFMDDGARLWYGAGGSHQPMAGAPQVDALALHDQVTDTQHFF